MVHKFIGIVLLLFVSLFFGVSAGLSGTQEKEVSNSVESVSKQTKTNGKTVSLTFTDIDGKVHTPFGNTASKGAVIVFVKDDCPIANAYVPELNRLGKVFQEKKVDLFLVYPTAGIKKAKLVDHRKKFKIEVPQIVDSKQTIARKLQAKVTPEAFLVSSKGAVLYRGRIDNLYAGYGKKRVKASRKDLSDAVDVMLKGGFPAVSTTKPYGCFIHYEKK